MARRKLTVDRHEEIKRRLADGRSLREIATALGCSRRLVRQIRDGERLTHDTVLRPSLSMRNSLLLPEFIQSILRVGIRVSPGHRPWNGGW
jgi:predicted transcriptional regulator